MSSKDIASIRRDYALKQLDEIEVNFHFMIVHVNQESPP